MTKIVVDPKTSLTRGPNRPFRCLDSFWDCLNCSIRTLGAQPSLEISTLVQSNIARNVENGCSLGSWNIYLLIFWIGWNHVNPHVQRAQNMYTVNGISTFPPLIPETSEILVSREFSRFFFHFHFSFSISSRFNFTFTSRKRVKGFYFSLFTSRKKWNLSVFHFFFSRKKSKIRRGL